jgi:hypothetical protein
VESDVAAGAHLSEGAGCWVVDSVAGNIGASKVIDGAGITISERDASLLRVKPAVDADVPAWVTGEKLAISTLF